MICWNNIEKLAKQIVDERWTDGISVQFGDSQNDFFLSSGFTDGTNKTFVSSSTVYDLASVTKLFTLIAVMKLNEKGIIDIEKPIKTYSSNFPAIKNVKLFELMNFSKELVTPLRIDSCKSYQEALSVLYDVHCSGSEVVYSDIGIILLSIIINAVLGSENGFKDYLKDMFSGCGMKKTFWWNDIPPEILSNVLCYDNEFRLLNGKLECIHTPQGMVHDKKAQVLGTGGHAGIFSTPGDIALWVRKILMGEIIHQNTIAIIASDQYNAYSPVQSFGLMCYKKNPIKEKSEIPHSASSHSIAISGYTGTYFLIDFRNMMYVFIGANRINNRLTNVGNMDISNIPPVKCTKNYVYRKDPLRDACAEFCLQKKRCIQK